MGEAKRRKAEIAALKARDRSPDPLQTLKNLFTPENYVAFHEASHAVFALKFGFGVSKVTLIGDEKQRYDAQTFVEVPGYMMGNGTKYLPVIYNDALVDMAGVVMDILYRGYDDFKAHGSTDYKYVCEKLRFYLALEHDLMDEQAVYDVDCNRLREEVWDQHFEKEGDLQKKLQELTAKSMANATTLIKANVPAIITVGQELFRRKTLTEDDLIDLTLGSLGRRLAANH